MPLYYCSVSTWPLALCPKAVMTAPLEVLTAARFFAAPPPTEVNLPPM